MDASMLIVEDHPLYRDALVRLLSGKYGGTCALVASSAEDGLTIAAREPLLRIVLIDMGLPGMSGMEAISMFRQVCPGAQLIAISGSDDRREVSSSFRLGVKAFVSKAAPPDLLISAVDWVLHDGLGGPRWVTGHAEAPPSVGIDKQPTLRQQEILGLLNDGHSNKEIGLRLGISEVRVKQHISALLRMFGTSNRMQLVLASRRQRLPAPSFRGDAGLRAS